jgi:hypothetical protein
MVINGVIGNKERCCFHVVAVGAVMPEAPEFFGKQRVRVAQCNE